MRSQPPEPQLSKEDPGGGEVTLNFLSFTGKRSGAAWQLIAYQRVY